MPIFEYECEKCRETFEKIVFKNDPEDRIACPRCGKTRVRRLMSASSFLGGKHDSGCAPSTGSRFS